MGYAGRTAAFVLPPLIIMLMGYPVTDGALLAKKKDAVWYADRALGS